AITRCPHRHQFAEIGGCDLLEERLGCFRFTIRSAEHQNHVIMSQTKVDVSSGCRRFAPWLAVALAKAAAKRAADIANHTRSASLTERRIQISRACDHLFLAAAKLLPPIKSRSNKPCI